MKARLMAAFYVLLVIVAVPFYILMGDMCLAWYRHIKWVFEYTDVEPPRPTFAERILASLLDEEPCSFGTFGFIDGAKRFWDESQGRPISIRGYPECVKLSMSKAIIKWECQGSPRYYETLESLENPISISIACMRKIKAYYGDDCVYTPQRERCENGMGEKLFVGVMCGEGRGPSFIVIDPEKSCNTIR